MTPARRIALALAGGAEAALAESRGRLDDLNVYPVPDGDTGTNLAATVTAVAAALRDGPDEEPAALARTATRAALMGARGNSGIILSQIVRGVAEVLGGQDEPSPAVVARALRCACDAAYRAVRQPVEGTMLSTVRSVAEAAEASASRSPADLDRLLDQAVAAADRAVARTPELLPVLREAGVVDAGAAGLAEGLRGAVAGLRGEAAAPAEAVLAALPEDALHAQPSRYRYCTSFVVEGPDVDPAELEARLEPLGDSLLVVGEGEEFRVHVHTDDPAAALAIGLVAGELDGVGISNMHRQTEARERRLAAPALRLVEGGARTASAVVAVAVGVGNLEAFRREGAAEVLDGGATMNPSTEELLAAIERAPADAVIVLPNNRNAVLAAEHAVAAAREQGLRAAVVPTPSMTAGLSALVGFSAEAPLEENVDALVELAGSVRSGELGVAGRSATIDGREVASGAVVGFAGDRLVATGGDGEAVADAVAAALLEPGGDVLTAIRGDRDLFDVEAWSRRVGEAHPGLEVVLVEGGQPHRPLLLAVE